MSSIHTIPHFLSALSKYFHALLSPDINSLT
jgi:hypothetical protein